MLGSTVLIPFLIVPKFGGTEDDLARVIGTIFFVSVRHLAAGQVSDSCTHATGR